MPFRILKARIAVSQPILNQNAELGQYMEPTTADVQKLASSSQTAPTIAERIRSVVGPPGFEFPGAPLPGSRGRLPLAVPSHASGGWALSYQARLRPRLCK